VIGCVSVAVALYLLTSFAYVSGLSSSQIANAGTLAVLASSGSCRPSSCRVGTARGSSSSWQSLLRRLAWPSSTL
jgi:hypothetical protein